MEHGKYSERKVSSSTRVSKIRFRVVFMVKDIQVMFINFINSVLCTHDCKLLTYFCPPYIHVEQVESWD